ncbi:ATP-grasp fold amidoligase family protein [Geomonas oryzae]|uniref:ATP-grasp fold amidoligase family protein n=1 Tax=Geomonas oryzae TaxID=2364273 RepID=UPI0013A5E75E|nr:ATP-grasp fold amidoligase family protein [Geomonas oryzae]
MLKFIVSFLEVTERFGVKLKGKYRPYDCFPLMFIIDAILWPSDLYKILTDYKKRFGSTPNLVVPRTFNEHIQRSKLTTRKMIYIDFADKIRVRDYVEKIIGKQYLIEILWTGTDIRDVNKERLPESFIIKANNGSGMNLVVPDKKAADWLSIHSLTQQWLCRDFSKYFAEWQYRWVRPQLLIEPLLTFEGRIPYDYKFFCFNGKVELIQVDMDRFTNHTLTLLNRQFKVLPIRHVYPCHQGTLVRPACLDEMINLAEKLAGKEKFIRIDFYDVNGRPIFGEITLHPSAGREHFEPPIWDKRLGDILSRKCAGDTLIEKQ